MRDGFNRPHALIRTNQPALAIRADSPGKRRPSGVQRLLLRRVLAVVGLTRNPDVRHHRPGDWWWRLCNKSINGEDDKCSYDSAVAPRKLTLTAKPAPPPDLCTDGLDNDGDGKTDLDDMDNDNANDTKLWCDQIKPAAKPAPTTRPALLPRLTVSDAKSYIRTVLKRRFGDAYRYAQARGSHAVTGAHAPRCGAMSSSSPAT
jgi:hypothetical protein